MEQHQIVNALKHISTQITSLKQPEAKPSRSDDLSAIEARSFRTNPYHPYPIYIHRFGAVAVIARGDSFAFLRGADARLGQPGEAESVQVLATHRRTRVLKRGA